MRIAILSETFLPKVDGISNTLCHLLDYLGNSGHPSLLFAPKGGPSYYAKTPIVTLPAFPAPGYPELRVIYPWINVARRLTQFKPDIVHLVSPFGYTLFGLLSARQLGIPTVASYHTDVPGFAERMGLGIFKNPLWGYFRWLHNLADINLVPSHFTRRQIEAKGFQRVGIWSRGVDTTLYNPNQRSQAWRSRLAIGNPDAPILLYAGRLALEKRVEMLKPVIDSLPGVHLAIVGDGPQRMNLERVFAGTPTTFTGYLHGNDLAQAYASADLFVFTGANETFGNVVTEALSSGLPTVVPDSGGVIEHVQNGRTGLLFPSESPQALQDAVTSLVNNPAILNQMSRAARVYMENYTWENVMGQLITQYQSLKSTQPRTKQSPAIRRAYQTLSEGKNGIR